MNLKGEIIRILTKHTGINFAQLWLYLLEVDVTITYEAIHSELEILESHKVVTCQIGNTSLNDVWTLVK
ncbi:MAG: hypothetical protein N5P05_000486 [Chroococcopsis gigantea SAG 12.99]|jgi:hypothetical protein|nr:hypothetical protein [Chroococcopsis gigantea SAG 12.99]